MPGALLRKQKLAVEVKVQQSCEGIVKGNRFKPGELPILFQDQKLRFQEEDRGAVTVDRGPVTEDRGGVTEDRGAATEDRGGTTED